MFISINILLNANIYINYLIPQGYFFSTILITTGLLGLAAICAKLFKFNKSSLNNEIVLNAEISNKFNYNVLLAVSIDKLALDLNFEGSSIYWLPELVLIFILIFTLIIILVKYNKYTKNVEKLYKKNLKIFTTFTFIAFLILIGIFINYQFFSAEPFLIVYKERLSLDVFSISFKIIILLLSLFTFLFFFHFEAKNLKLIWELPLMLLLSFILMLLLVSSKNLLTTFLCIEALSFCLYFILASSNTKGTLGNLLIYFILGAISSVIFALGIARIYLIVGSFDYIEIRYFFANVSELHSIWSGSPYIATVSFLIFGFLFKLAVFPLYFWITNLYKNIPIPILLFFALPVKLAIFAAFFKLIVYPLTSLSYIWSIILLYTGIGSLIVGCVMALYAITIPAFIAGSGINHLGFILIGIACDDTSGATSALLHLLNYTITSAAFFLIFLSLKKWNSTGHYPYFIKDLKIIKNYPFLNIAYIITIFSFAGIPPFAGFFSKFNILLSLYDKGYIFICLIVIIMTLLSTYYYLRLLAIVNFGGNPIPFDKKLRVFIDEILSVPNKFNKVLPIKDLISNIKKIKVIHFYDSFHFLLLLFTGYNTIFLFLWYIIWDFCSAVVYSGMYPIIYAMHIIW